METNLLEMRGISKRFPGVIALAEVDFAVAEGEIVALLGENGAGKSTLMKILGGIHQPDAGEITVAGAARKFASVNDSINCGIGFIHQELNMLDNLDVAGNVYLGREPLRGGLLAPLRLIDRAKMNAESAVYLRQLGLTVAPDMPLSRLTLAQKQLVEIAKALSLKARLLIMDEPTSSLTLTETERLLQVIKEIRAQGVSIIYISHRLGEVVEIADRAVVLRDGRNAGELAGAEITQERIVQMMVGRALSHHYEPPSAPPLPDYFTVREVATRRYPRQNVSFTVGQGEIFGIAGLVGAGRSDLAQTIFGVEGWHKGEVCINQKVMHAGSTKEAIKHGLYLIPEDRRHTGLITETNIRENITLPALERYSRNGLLSVKKERVTAENLCAKLKVKARSTETMVKNLSGGNQQKVVLAKWLQLDPKVIIFDEPTRGIDVGAKAEIYELMRDLAQNGVSLVVISSDMEEILGLSDRLAVMHEGRITGILDRHECNEENVMRLAVGQAKTVPAGVRETSQIL